MLDNYSITLSATNSWHHDEPLPAGADHPSSPRGKRPQALPAQPVGVATAHRREAAGRKSEVSSGPLTDSGDTFIPLS